MPIRPAAEHLRDVTPYDPKYIAVDVMLSANENTADLPPDLRRQVESAIRATAFNRYPDPLANDLRDLIAEANGLTRDCVLVGNGGDELLFNIALAWGGPGRKFLNMPPTFSIYQANARLTHTETVDVHRLADFSIDEVAVVARLLQGDIDFTIVTSPNNPSGNLVEFSTVARMLEATDALVVVDEAYFEFSRNTARPLLDRFPNLLILRTFSKAFSLAGVRLGYVLGSPQVIRELMKVRQPYSVDAISQAVGRVVYENRASFEQVIDAIIAERERLFAQLEQVDGVKAHPSDANYILLELAVEHDASAVWQRLLDAGVLVRDFSSAPGLENCLRVSVGNAEENDRFLEALKESLGKL